MEPQRNKASGFTPHLEPIFELKKGNVVATADLALPVGVEVALDILGGTWKKSVGWDATQVEPSSTLFDKVATTFGGQENLASNITFNLTKPGPIIYEDEHFQSKSSKDDKNKLRKLPKTNGFRLIQDAGQTSTLVSGKDGRIYMANNSAEYDISAPWGGLEVDKNIFSYDVFGRLIWFDAEHLSDSFILGATVVRQERANRPKSPPRSGDGSTELTQDATLVTPTNTGKLNAQGTSHNHNSLPSAPVLSPRLASNVLAGEAAGGSWPKVLSRLREAFCLDPQGGPEEQRMAVGQAHISHPTALHHAELERLESAVHAFPPQPIASFLLSVLIKHATDTFFYVDQAEFASEIHQFYTDSTSPLRSDSSFVGLAMAAFALASQWTTLEKPEGHQTSVGLERSDLGRVFFDHARMLIPDIIERPCLRSVQAPFVLGVYLMPASAIGSSYVYLGLALRKALALDLHQDVDDQKLNEREIEVRRRLWWSLYSLERCTTVKLNRPRSISVVAITTPIPSGLPALDRSQKFDNLSFQLAYMRLVKILDQISDPELGSTGDELALLAKYESDLKEWKRSLPLEFKLEDTDPQDSRYRAVFHLYLNYYYAWITIGKASLISVVRAKLRSCATGSQPPQISNVARNLSRSCAKAARKLLGLFETVSMSHKITRFSFTDFQGCSIATIVTLLDGIPERDSGYEARVASGLEHLRQMAIGNATAKIGVRNRPRDSVKERLRYLWCLKP
ncbi:fungal-specific transcription factor domain-containing protein [Aspergillus novoparasiticus]|uniref:Fungal-specific transcription factor domain-containing protein n=1 Tax=Aspergillus novoparasiticus TaxID=986946 RepID=A0A5N6F410_9EURO|nr:fungal-specific transcription factor domain-containing protein [Aspergillus novoparasiticus]